MSRIYIPLAIAAGISVFVVLIYAKGHSDGSNEAEAEARAKTVERLTTRNKIDADVSTLDSADLCKRLGGMWRDDRCE